VTGFTADWLALRESADAAARSDDIFAALNLPSWRGEGIVDVIDLGAGTGANLRYVAPRLAARQRWLLVDDDAELLARAAATQPPTKARAAFDADAATRRIDLARSLDAVPIPRHSLVTASALLDLVSAAWLHALASRCAAAETAVLFALTYDGRIDATPDEPEDAVIRELVNRDQQRDKGFGPALGPAAPAAAVDAFESRGYRLQSAPSDWQLEPADRALQRALIDGWAAAATEADPTLRETIERWQSRRLEHVAAGRSRLRVGHVDIAGRPAST
jgi:SAM-dependent methyltransferase